MNKCLIKMYGPVKEVIKFMVNEMNFVSATDNGLQFVAEVNFAQSMRENDELFLQDNYSVAPVSCCEKMEVDVQQFYTQDDEEYDYEYDDVKHLYKFHLIKSGKIYFELYKNFEKEVCFNDKHVSDNMEFMSEFFNYFKTPYNYAVSKELKQRLDAHMAFSFEVYTYGLPVSVFNNWLEKYQVRLVGTYGDENEIVVFDKDFAMLSYVDEVKEENFIFRFDAEKDRLTYMCKLLSHKWADNFKLLQDVCDMLYDLKDAVPFEVDLELKENDGLKGMSKYKYNKFYGNMSSAIFELARTSPNQLAKLYVWLENAHKNFLANK